MIPIIPVLDVMNGVVVRAIGGRRNEYKPIVSRLTKSTEPTDVLKALIDVTGSDTAYIADLDAIVTGNGPSQVVLELLEKAGVKLWIDFGVKTASDLERLPGNCSPVLGTETVSSTEVVTTASERFPHVVGSIDLRAGEPLGLGAGKEFWDICLDFFATGVTDLIVLDLAGVGTDGGSTYDWCNQLTLFLGELLRIFAGGGIRTRDDVVRYESLGCAGVLVASALHDGTLP